jgi:nitrile hydratase accessory protein
MADELRPAFDEPWQAQAYALAQVLIETGRISSSQWAKAFAAGLREAAGQGKPDSSDTYYATLSETL